MKTPFCRQSVAYPLAEGEFSNLGTKQLAKIVRMMARAAEDAYRRGYQHGQHATRSGQQWADGYALRNFRNLDVSPFAHAVDANGKWHSNRGTTAIERLFLEHPVLSDLGFSSPLPIATE